MKDYRNEPEPEFPNEYGDDEAFGPDPEPLTVPAGNYLCQFAGSVVKRPSQYGAGESYYYEMPLKIRDAAGNNYEYKFNFSNSKNQVYGEVMKLGGGEEQKNRVIKLPPKTSIIGKLFMAQIIERQAKNDKTKILNDILRVWKYVPKKKPEPEPEPEPQPETKIPSKEAKTAKEDFPSSPEEDEVPF